MGTAPVQRGLLLGDELRQRLGLEEPARHEEVGAGHPRRRTGMPHALAWNIGTIGSTRSRSVKHDRGRLHTPIECRNVERCE